MSLVPLLINLACGAIGGNVAGGVVKKISLGTLGNSLAGILGGGLGGQILAMLGLMPGGEGGAIDLTSILGNVGAGGVGGGVVLAIIGVIKNVLMGGKAAS